MKRNVQRRSAEETTRRKIKTATKRKRKVRLATVRRKRKKDPQDKEENQGNPENQESLEVMMTEEINKTTVEVMAKVVAAEEVAAAEEEEAAVVDAVAMTVKARNTKMAMARLEDTTLGREKKEKTANLATEVAVAGTPDQHAQKMMIANVSAVMASRSPRPQEVMVKEEDHMEVTAVIEAEVEEVEVVVKEEAEVVVVEEAEAVKTANRPVIPPMLPSKPKIDNSEDHSDYGRTV